MSAEFFVLKWSVRCEIPKTATTAVCHGIIVAPHSFTSRCKVVTITRLRSMCAQVRHLPRVDHIPVSAHLDGFSRRKESHLSSSLQCTQSRRYKEKDRVGASDSSLRPGRVRSIAVVSVFVCLSVCLFAYLKWLQNYSSKLHKIFCVFYPSSWLDPLLTTIQYVTYFRFCGRRHVFTQWGIQAYFAHAL